MADLTLADPASNGKRDLNPLISVATCSYNLADRLVLALEGLRRQFLPDEYFEIPVVDNASYEWS